LLIRKANQTVAFFFRILVCFGLLATNVSVATGLDASTFACLLASINFCNFSGNPLLFAVLLLALVSDFCRQWGPHCEPVFFSVLFLIHSVEDKMLLRELSHLFSAFKTDYFVVLDGILWCELRCGHFLFGSWS